MACCVVLRHLSSDGCRADVADDAPSVRSSPRSLGRHNHKPAVGGGRVSTASRHKVSGGGVSDAACAEVFKEPWAKLLSQAKAKLASDARKPKRNECQESQSTPSVSALTGNEASSKCKRKEGSSSPEEHQDVPGEDSTIPRGRPRTHSSNLSAKRAGKRASSVEWDYSESDSAETPPVPKGKQKKCSRRKKRANSIDSHFIDDGSDPNESEVETSNSFDSSHQCCICNMKFKRPWLLRTHLYKHIQPDKRPFSCDKEGCSKAYYFKAHLERHKSISHSDITVVVKIPCPSKECGKIFGSQCGLKRHINKEHSKENLKFQCPQCDKTFSKNRQLTFHIAEHTGKPPLRCDKCNMGAYSESALKRHMRSHREYPCTVPGCEQVLPNISASRKHMAEHNRCFQSLRCAHCQKEFSKKDNLRQHVLIHLENKSIFRCTYNSCPRFYYQERNLKAHVRLRHKNMSNFACDWPGCEMLFMSNRALTKHINVHKNGKAPIKFKKSRRAPRKDKGIRRRSMASRLTGLAIPPDVERDIFISQSIISTDSESEADGANNNRCDWKSHLRNVRKKPLEDSAKATQSAIVTGHVDALPSTCLPDERNLQEDNMVLQSTPLSVDENLILSLTGKIFEVNEAGELVEVQNDSAYEGCNVKQRELIPPNACAVTSEKSGEVIPSSEEADIIELETPVIEASPSVSYVEATLSGICVESLDCNLEESQAHLSSSFTNPSFIVKDESCILSATLCAETIVECPSFLAESEVLVFLPKISQETLTDGGIGFLDSDAVVKALTGDVEVYSVAGKDSAMPGTLHSDQLLETAHQEIPKRISPDDPSVTNILKPLIENLTSQRAHLDNELLADFECVTLKMKDDENDNEAAKKIEAKETSPVSLCTDADNVSTSADAPCVPNCSKNRKDKTKSSMKVKSDKGSIIKKHFLNPVFKLTVQGEEGGNKRPRSKVPVGAVGAAPAPPCEPLELKVMNPAHMHHLISKFASFIQSSASNLPLMKSTPEIGRSVKGHLQGPTQDPTESDSSSVSDSEDSRSDSGSEGGYNDYSSQEEDVVDDNASDDGGSGNDDNEEEDDEADEQPEEEEEDNNDDDDDDENEDENDENGNNNGGQLNGDNNNDDADNSDSDNSEKHVDPESTNEHLNIGDGSDLGVDRAASPRHNFPEETEDDVSSTCSDDLVIDTDRHPSDEFSSPTVNKAVTKSNKPVSQAAVEKTTKSVASPKKKQPTFKKATELDAMPKEKEEDYDDDTPLCQRLSTRLRELDNLKVRKIESKFPLVKGIKKLVQVRKHKGCQEEGTKRINETVAVISGTSVMPNMYANVKQTLKKEKGDVVLQVVVKKANPCKGKEVAVDSVNGNANKSRMKRPSHIKRNIIDSSSSDHSPPKRRRINSISDIYSDTTVLLSSPEPPKSLYISIGEIDQNTSNVSTSPCKSEDPLQRSMQDEKFSLEHLKTFPKTVMACKQLSASAWINVLRQTCKVMKLS